MKFSLVNIREERELLGTSFVAESLGEFTAPENLENYPDGLLEYMVQCAREHGSKHDRIGFKIADYIYDEYEYQDDLCERIIYELVTKHHQPLPDPDESTYFLKIRSIIRNPNASRIVLPSGVWSYALYSQISTQKSGKVEVGPRYCRAIELELIEEPV